MDKLQKSIENLIEEKQRILKIIAIFEHFGDLGIDPIA